MLHNDFLKLDVVTEAMEFVTQVDGKLLCWSCGQSYRRVVRKLHQKRNISAAASMSITPSSEEATPGSSMIPHDNTPKERAAKARDVISRGGGDADDSESKVKVTTPVGDRPNKDIVRSSSNSALKHRTNDSEDARYCFV